MSAQVIAIGSKDQVWLQALRLGAERTTPKKLNS
jgi:hypothetical protein